MRDPQLPLTIKERSEWGDPLNDQVRSGAVSMQVR
jgi:protease II